MRFRPISLFFLVLPLLACGDEGGVVIEGGSTSRAELGRRDDDRMKILLTLREIHAHVVGGPEHHEKQRNRRGLEWETKKGKWRVATLERSRTFDLLAVERRPVRLGWLDLPEGKITQIRLFLDEEGPNEVVLPDGQRCPLFIPSAEQTGIKIVKPFKVDVEDGDVHLMIDFNLRESIQRDEGCAYRLSPVFKVRVRD